MYKHILPMQTINDKIIVHRRMFVKCSFVLDNMFSPCMSYMQSKNYLHYNCFAAPYTEGIGCIVHSTDVEEHSGFMELIYVFMFIYHK